MERLPIKVKSKIHCLAHRVGDVITVPWKDGYMCPFCTKKVDTSKQLYDHVRNSAHSDANGYLESPPEGTFYVPEILRRTAIVIDKTTDYAVCRFRSELLSKVGISQHTKKCDFCEEVLDELVQSLLCKDVMNLAVFNPTEGLPAPLAGAEVQVKKFCNECNQIVDNEDHNRHDVREVPVMRFLLNKIWYQYQVKSLLPVNTQFTYNAANAELLRMPVAHNINSPEAPSYALNGGLSEIMENFEVQREVREDAVNAIKYYVYLVYQDMDGFESLREFVCADSGRERGVFGKLRSGRSLQSYIQVFARIVVTIMTSNIGLSNNQANQLRTFELELGKGGPTQSEVKSMRPKASLDDYESDCDSDLDCEVYVDSAGFINAREQLLHGGGAVESGIELSHPIPSTLFKFMNERREGFNFGKYNSLMTALHMFLLSLLCEPCTSTTQPVIMRGLAVQLSDYGTSWKNTMSVPPVVNSVSYVLRLVILGNASKQTDLVEGLQNTLNVSFLISKFCFSSQQPCLYPLLSKIRRLAKNEPCAIINNISYVEESKTVMINDAAISPANYHAMIQSSVQKIWELMGEVHENLADLIKYRKTPVIRDDINNVVPGYSFWTEARNCFDKVFGLEAVEKFQIGTTTPRYWHKSTTLRTSSCVLSTAVLLETPESQNFCGFPSSTLRRSGR